MVFVSFGNVTCSGNFYVVVRHTFNSAVYEALQAIKEALAHVEALSRPDGCTLYRIPESQIQPSRFWRRCTGKTGAQRRHEKRRRFVQRLQAAT